MSHNRRSSTCFFRGQGFWAVTFGPHLQNERCTRSALRPVANSKRCKPAAVEAKGEKALRKTAKVERQLPSRVTALASSQGGARRRIHENQGCR